MNLPVFSKLKPSTEKVACYFHQNKSDWAQLLVDFDNRISV